MYEPSLILLRVLIQMSNPMCPKCEKSPQYSQSVGEAFTSHICYKTCGYQFWTLRICPHCQQPHKTVFLNKPNFGQIITCTNCNHSMYYFRCPKQDCLELFYKEKNYYRMGSNVSCVTCSYTFKLISCICGGQNILEEEDIVFEGHNKFNCKCCKKEFTFTVCPGCEALEYHIDKIDVGDRIRCGTCKLWRKYVPCPKCGKTLTGERFMFCDPNHCYHCGVIFEYSKCAFGCNGFNFNILDKPIGPHRYCFNCKQNYCVINCRKCENPLYFQKIDSNMITTDACPHCKTKIKYYYCNVCKQFNEQGIKCKSQFCPPPKGERDNTIKPKQKEKQRRSQPSGQGQLNEDCKICYDGKAVMINEVCSHLMMCQTCVQNIQNKNRNQRIPCPICKQIGRYFVFKKPIYS